MSPDDLLDLHSRVFRWATRHGSADPEALASEVVLRCWIAQQHGQELNVGFPWTVAKHLLVDEFRRLDGRYDLPLEVIAPYLGDPRADAELEESEAVMDAERVVAHLTAMQRAVLLLVAEGCRGHEISARLGVSVDAVKKLKERGQAQARKIAC